MHNTNKLKHRSNQTDSHWRAFSNWNIIRWTCFLGKGFLLFDLRKPSRDNPRRGKTRQVKLWSSKQSKRRIQFLASYVLRMVIVYTRKCQSLCLPSSLWIILQYGKQYFSFIFAKLCRVSFVMAHFHCIHFIRWSEPVYSINGREKARSNGFIDYVLGYCQVYIFARGNADRYTYIRQE